MSILYNPMKASEMKRLFISSQMMNLKVISGLAKIKHVGQQPNI